MSRPVVVTIDGPAGAGKSTVARMLAHRLGYRLLDTGAIYRTLALAAERGAIGWGDGPGLAALALALPIEFQFEGEQNRVLLQGADVSSSIRTPEISIGASQVSAHPEVRAALLDVQRRLGSGGGVVVEGRDTGTVVFPNAGAKFFLTASDEVRARRRVEELRAAGTNVEFEATLRDMQVRDRRDTERTVAPMIAAADAIRVDSSDRPIEDVISELETVVRQRAV